MKDKKKIYLYNSLTQKREIFHPINSNKVNIYSCGPTIYDYAHIGNYRSFLFSDLLHRVFKYLGYEVTLVMNLTDIDDKTIQSAIREGKSLAEYTKRFELAFFEDLKALNVYPASHYPKATKYVNEMVDLIKTLIHKGYAYQTNGSVYFKIDAFKEYGKLSKIKITEQQVGASGRIDSDEYEKENATDFVLWKKYHLDDGEVYYDTILGKGRPGWHIECSAMSKHFLGEHFDIHTGGIDNRFPHHENEIAQSECAHGSQYVNYWLHVSHLLVENEKMSKSAGNFFTLRDLLKKNISPRTIRYMLLSVHYRGQYNFTEVGINSADKALNRIDNFLSILNRLQKQSRNKSHNAKPTELYQDDEKYLVAKEKEFFDYLCDDLNVSGALGSLFEYISHANKILSKLEINLKNGVDEVGSLNTMITFMQSVNKCLGIIPQNLLDFTIQHKDEILPELRELLNQRNAARVNKKFSEADRLRDEILAMGYVIIDTPNGSELKKK